MEQTTQSNRRRNMKPDEVAIMALFLAQLTVGVYLMVVHMYEATAFQLVGFAFGLLGIFAMISARSIADSEAAIGGLMSGGMLTVLGFAALMEGGVSWFSLGASFILMAAIFLLATRWA